MVGDWTRELKRVVAEGDDPSSMFDRAQFGELGNLNHKGYIKATFTLRVLNLALFLISLSLV